jgi:hypothetical protein
LKQSFFRKFPLAATAAGGAAVCAGRAGQLYVAFARAAQFVETIQSDSTCPALFAKIYPFSPDPNHLHIPVRPASLEGRFAIVTDVGGGMRWTRMAL